MTPIPFSLDEAPHGPIRGDIYLPEIARGAPVVVACHGFKGFKDWGFWPETGRRLTDEGIGLVTFNFSGSGIGEDPLAFTELDRFEANTFGRELDDLGRVLEAVTRREIPMGATDVRKLALLGHSRGGGVALARASRDPRVQALVTWSSVCTFDRYDEDTRARWRERGYIEVENARTGQIFRLGLGLLEDLETHTDAYDLIAAAGRFIHPYLIIHGTRDEAVPVEEADRLSKAADPGLSRVMLVEGAGHTFGAAHPFVGSTPELDRVLTRTAAWVKESLL